MLNFPPARNCHYKINDHFIIRKRSFKQYIAIGHMALPAELGYAKQTLDYFVVYKIIQKSGYRAKQN